MDKRVIKTPLAGWSDRAVLIFIGVSVATVFGFLFLIIVGVSFSPRSGDDSDGRVGSLQPGRLQRPPPLILTGAPNRKTAEVSQTPAAQHSHDRLNVDHFRECWGMSQHRSNTERSVEMYFGALAQAAAARGPAKRIAAETGLPWRTVEDRAARPRAGLAVTLLLLARWDRALGDEIKRFIDQPGTSGAAVSPQPEPADGQNQLCEGST